MKPEQPNVDYENIRRQLQVLAEAAGQLTADIESLQKQLETPLRNPVQEVVAKYEPHDADILWAHSQLLQYPDAVLDLRRARSQTSEVVR